MTHEFLNSSDVVAIFEQVRCERVPEGMACHPLRDSRAMTRLGDGAPKDGLVQMMPPNLAGRAFFVGASCGNDPLPPPRSAPERNFERPAVGQGVTLAVALTRAE